MACHIEPLTFDSLINLAIRLDYLLHSHCPHRETLGSQGASASSEPMQLRHTKLSKGEGEKQCRKH